MFLKLIDLTTALRPAYLPDEVLLLVQDNVGLYEGKFKLPNQQNGQVYLTSHRICYVDKQEPRKHSVGLDLKDIERHEFYAGFLKSSAKVTLIPRQAKRSSFQSRTATSTAISSPSRSNTGTPSQASDSGYRAPQPPSAPQATAATWVCTICSFPNPVPSNFDPATANVHTPLPPCLACGIKPALTHVLKAAISNVASRQIPSPSIASPSPSVPSLVTTGTAASLADTTDTGSPPPGELPPSRTASDGVHCPRCTFLNHPSLLSCELCGAPLVTGEPQVPNSAREPVRVDSPGPMLTVGSIAGLENPESVKISFRAGGEKVFYEKLKGSLTQRKWLLHAAPPVPGRNDDGRFGDGRARDSGGSVRVRSAGIAGLEQMGLDKRKNTELTIGNAFEDIDALMASAQEVIALANSLGRQLNSDGSSPEVAMLAESVSQLGLVTTKDIVGGGGGSGSESLYISELSRNLAEFLTDDARGVLKKAGGIVSLVDLWAIFNRARGGVELVSPVEFEKAARLWEDLKLPVRLRTFKSGVMVVQSRDRTDETTIRSLLAWLRDLHEFPPDKDVPWDWREFGRGVTALDAAERFGWSIGVAEEELEMAEERGVLCREEGIEGLKFWENFIDTEARRAERKQAEKHGKRRDKALSESDKLIQALNASGIL
ncbi:EAP30/Vps36 family-domain-containing protein [Microdochium trichocladiopsis]|uniref:Vacuolar protein-sorting-associated protein 36 n=1 Tax=Microdochium trichocladiopsis TaxID=1682393 RepID=A0A9P8YER3_9PEZI|nr:EAP30/Vps36 family-domain-containing protein [Microdochium trichocladiopsis]KAH7035637.1 EAP30/Vps36 family-domain-containing protein [Microdochium trichocladiopsis]